MENEIKDFWQMHPCGAELVGDLSEETRVEYEDFFARYDAFRYAKEPHILTNLDRIDFANKRVLEIGLGQGADAEQIVRRGGMYSGADLTEESVKRVKCVFRSTICHLTELNRQVLLTCRSMIVLLTLCSATACSIISPISKRLRPSSPAC